MSLIYRKAEHSDAEQLLLHIQAVGGETDNLTYGKDTFVIPKEREARFISRFSNSKRDLMLVVVDTFSGEIVANGIVEHNRIERLSHTAELTVTVLKSHWSEGIVTELMKLMIEHAKEQGTHMLNVIVRSDNYRAIHLYEKFGFKKSGSYPDYFLINNNYYDVDMMCLKLT